MKSNEHRLPAVELCTPAVFVPELPKESGGYFFGSEYTDRQSRAPRDSPQDGVIAH